MFVLSSRFFTLKTHKVYASREIQEPYLMQQSWDWIKNPKVQKTVACLCTYCSIRSRFQSFLTFVTTLWFWFWSFAPSYRTFIEEAPGEVQPKKCLRRTHNMMLKLLCDPYFVFLSCIKELLLIGANENVWWAILSFVPCMCWFLFFFPASETLLFVCFSVVVKQDCIFQKHVPSLPYLCFCFLECFPLVLCNESLKCFISL